MEDYIKWLENKIEVCLEDKDLQREHWAFCQAFKKHRELALRQPPVSSSLPLQTKLEMFYDFLYEGGIAKQLGVGIDTIVKHFIEERLSGNDR